MQQSCSYERHRIVFSAGENPKTFDSAALEYFKNNIHLWGKTETYRRLDPLFLKFLFRCIYGDLQIVVQGEVHMYWVYCCWLTCKWIGSTNYQKSRNKTKLHNLKPPAWSSYLNGFLRALSYYSLQVRQKVSATLIVALTHSKLSFS